jgi:LPXTG-motif cell wall-anchored protein
MSFRGKALTAALALAFAATLTTAQSADPNTGAPTKNTFRLRVLEPAEGATITGSSVRVAASTLIPGEADTRNIAPTDRTPRPEVVVFLDNSQKAVLDQETNTVTIDNVPAGAHKLVLLAKNSSGEIVDRKEINFTSTMPMAASETTTSAPAPVMAAPPAAREPAPAPVAAPPPAPVRQETTVVTTTDEPEPTTSDVPETLPQTASQLPLAALAGAGLLVAGAALRLRRQRS